MNSLRTVPTERCGKGFPYIILLFIVMMVFSQTAAAVVAGTGTWV